MNSRRIPSRDYHWHVISSLAVAFALLIIIGAATRCAAAPKHTDSPSNSSENTSLTGAVAGLQAKLYYGNAMLKSSVDKQAVHIAVEAFQMAPRETTPYLKLRYYSLAAEFALTGGQLAQNNRAIANYKAFAQQAAIDLTKKALFAMKPLLKSLKAHQGSGASSIEYQIDEIQGRMAFLKGDYVQSCAYLLKSGSIAGDSAMASFGPDLSLAEALLRHGNKGTVIHFLIDVGKYWAPAGTMARSLQSGTSPVFSNQNVAYNLEPAEGHAP